MASKRTYLIALSLAMVVIALLVSISPTYSEESCAQLTLGPISIPLAKLTVIPIPTRFPLCPSGCECLTDSEANTKFGGNYEQCSTTICGRATEREFVVPKRCFRQKSIIPAIPKPRTPTPTPTTLRPLLPRLPLPGIDSTPTPVVERTRAPSPERTPVPSLDRTPILPTDRTPVRGLPTPSFPENCPLGCSCLSGREAEAIYGSSIQICSPSACGTAMEGDIVVSKFCTKGISTAECTDTDGGRNYQVKGSAPGCEDKCSPFSDPPVVLEECVAEIVDGKCTVGREYHDCGSLCQDGKCLPATCNDWIKNQGEEGVDCGGPCSIPCACPSGYVCSTVGAATDKYGAGRFTQAPDAVCGHQVQGDLNIPKYCHKKIESYECVDTDGGVNIGMKGIAPGCEDKCSPSPGVPAQMLEECYIDQTIDGCKVFSAPIKCEGLCQDGTCKPPTCEDGIQNQGEIAVDCSRGGVMEPCESCCKNGRQDSFEEGVDCGGPYCVPCGSIAIHGQIMYEDIMLDANGNYNASSYRFLPVRYGYFMIRGKEVDYLMKTDSAGYFNYILPRSDLWDQLVIVIGDPEEMFYERDIGFNSAANIVRDYVDCNEYVRWDSLGHQTPQTGTLNFGTLRIGSRVNHEFTGSWRETSDGGCGADGSQEGVIEGGSVYFNIADAILFARQYADERRSDEDDDTIGRVDVAYPYEDGDTSHYNGSEIELIESRGYWDGRIIHEYAHFLQDVISEKDYTANSDHEKCTYGRDEEFAWKEGFASYFGDIVVHTHSALSGPIFDFAWIETPVCPEFGWEGEATVAAILWDLVDDPVSFPFSIFEPFDIVKGKDALIFQVFDYKLDNQDDAGDLKEFIEQGLNCRVSEGDKAASHAMFRHYNVFFSMECKP